MNSMSFKFTQSGQALPLGLAFVLMALVASSLVYDTVQLSGDKMRLANAADAAAHSGMSWQARSMNFTAYTNRAMLANQVAIAQQVSLRSWMAHARTSTHNLSVVTRWIPGLNSATHAMDRAVASLEPVMDSFTRTAVVTLDAHASFLQGAQRLMFEHTMLLTPESITAVARASDPRFEADNLYTLARVAENLRQWRRFSRSVSKEDVDGMRERVGLINASRDRFSSSRHWDISVFKVGLYRQGRTLLQAQERGGRLEFEWRAKDAMTLRTPRLLSSRKTPIAWGQALSNDRFRGSIDDCSGSGVGVVTKACGRMLSSLHRKAERMSDRNVTLPGQRNSRVSMNRLYHGVRDFRDLSLRPDDVRDGRLQLHVELSLDANQIATAADLKHPGALDLASGIGGDTVSSLAVAELYYERPDRYQHRFDEFANAYNPYWAVRLIRPTQRERSAIILARGGAPMDTTPAQRVLYRSAP